MMRATTYLVATCLGLGLLLTGRPVSAANIEIDRTRRTIAVPDQCLSAALGADQALRVLTLNYPAGGLNVAGADGQLTFLLSTSANLRQRAARNTAIELSWYNFAPEKAAAEYNTGVAVPAQRLLRAVVMLRCGLPVRVQVRNGGGVGTTVDNNLYNYPADPAVRLAFVQYVLAAPNDQPVGADPRTASGYHLLRNNEREAILMYAATRIKFDLTPTIYGRNRICKLYRNLNSASDCKIDVPAPNPRDLTLGYLYEGVNRISYTGHEFWMMFDIDAFRDKVFFTNGTEDRLFGTVTVDRFVVWRPANGGQFQLVANDDPLVYPLTAGNAQAYRAYRFQDFIDGPNHDRNFHEVLLPAFYQAYSPSFVVVNDGR